MSQAVAVTEGELGSVIRLTEAEDPVEKIRKKVPWS